MLTTASLPDAADGLSAVGLLAATEYEAGATNRGSGEIAALAALAEVTISRRAAATPLRTALSAMGLLPGRVSNTLTERGSELLSTDA